MTSPNDRCFYPMQESDRLAACNEFRSRHSNERGLVSYGDLWVDHPFTEDPSNAIATFAKRVRDWYDSPLEDPFPLDALEELERQAPSNTQPLVALVATLKAEVHVPDAAMDTLESDLAEFRKGVLYAVGKLEAAMREGEGDR